MKRFAAVLLLWAFPLAGELPAQQEQVNRARVSELVIYPARAKRWLNRQRLLPDPRRQTRGEATGYYHRAMLLAYRNEVAPAAEGEEVRNELRRLEELFSRSSLTPQQVEEAERLFRKYRAVVLPQVMLQLRAAARCRSVQWRITPKDPRADWTQELMAQSLLHLLNSRMRLDLAQGRWSLVVRDLPLVFHFLEHLSEHPQLEMTLLAFSGWEEQLDHLQGVVQFARAPNLYFALVELAAHRPRCGGKVVSEGTHTLGLLREAVLRGPGPAPAGEAILGHALRLLLFEEFQGGMGLPYVFAAMVLDYPRTETVLARMPRILPSEKRKHLGSLQRVLLVWLLEAEVDFRRRSYRYQFAPSWHWPRLKQDLDAFPRPIYRVVFLPDAEKFFIRELQVWQLQQMLVVVEALRDHLARTGRLPQSLDEVQLPLPVDPASGKPFAYRLRDQVAELIAAPTGDPSTPRHVFRIRAGKPASRPGQDQTPKRPPDR